MCTARNLSSHMNQISKIIMTSKYFLSVWYAKLQASVVRVGRTGKVEPLPHPCYPSSSFTPTPLVITDQFSLAIALHKIPAWAGEQDHISTTSRMTSVAAQLMVLGKKRSFAIGNNERTVICKLIKYFLYSMWCGQVDIPLRVPLHEKHTSTGKKQG